MMLFSTCGRELNCWKFWIILNALFGMSSVSDSEEVSEEVLSELDMSDSNGSKSDSDPTRVLLSSELMNGSTSDMEDNDVRDSSLEIEIMET